MTKLQNMAWYCLAVLALSLAIIVIWLGIVVAINDFDSQPKYHFPPGTTDIVAMSAEDLALLEVSPGENIIIATLNLLSVFGSIAFCTIIALLIHFKIKKTTQCFDERDQLIEKKASHLALSVAFCLFMIAITILLGFSSLPDHSISGRWLSITFMTVMYVYHTVLFTTILVQYGRGANNG